MSASLRTLAAGVATLAILSLAVPLAHAWPNDATLNVPLGSSGYDLMGSPEIVSDGSGGWLTLHDADSDVSVTHLDANGIVRWSTPLLGYSVYVTSFQPVLASDGAGGAIVVFDDAGFPGRRVLAQRISAAGQRLWGDEGTVVCDTTTYHLWPSVVSDGAGGAIAGWIDWRTGHARVMVQRLGSDGSMLWTRYGVPASLDLQRSQPRAIMCPDGAGGAIIGWGDSLSATSTAIAVQRVSPQGVMRWGSGGRAVKTASIGYQFPCVAPDDQGGAFVMWEEPGGPFLQHLDESANLLWTAAGIPMSALGTGFDLDLEPDGQGGVIGAWSEGAAPSARIRTQRADGLGQMQWGANGVVLCATADAVSYPDIAPDGSGGAAISWTMGTYVLHSLRAQRLDPAGTPLWTADGLTYAGGAYSKYAASVAPDGTGGFVAVFADTRYANGTSAQRLDGWGVLGGDPLITRFRDLANDQGGYGYLQWNRSPIDVSGPSPISTYWLFRQAPAAMAQAALARGARMLGDDDAPDADPRGLYTTTQVDGATWYWEYIGSRVAVGQETYEVVVPTTCDSVAGQTPKRTVYMVMARGATAGFWTSPPDSGYSTDDLSPWAVSGATGNYIAAAFATVLSWDPLPIPDLAGYRIYRGGKTTFVAGPATYVGFTGASDYLDYAGEPFYYKIVAVDIHGNTSPFTLIVPSGIADAERAAPRELALSAPTPNPLRASTTLSLALPAAAHVSCAVFDAQGRRVRALLDGERAAGTHALVWDGRDDDGRPVASGLYVARVITGGRTLTRRIVAVR